MHNPMDRDDDDADKFSDPIALLGLYMYMHWKRSYNEDVLILNDSKPVTKVPRYPGVS